MAQTLLLFLPLEIQAQPGQTARTVSDLVLMAATVPMAFLTLKLVKQAKQVDRPLPDNSAAPAPTALQVIMETLARMLDRVMLV